MGLLDKLKDLEKEMERTQRNKATEHHFGLMKARLAKLRSQLLEPPKKSGAVGEGFDVQKHGHARVAMIGFPSVGKSTILSHFTETKSEVNERDFTTLTCIPGMLYYKNCKVQILDLPGIIEGASEGRGKGRQVIACAKSADLILIILDAARFKDQKEKILKELDLVGIRLNKEKPLISIKQISGGGIQLMSPYKLTKITHEEVRIVCHEYKVLNAQIVFKDDYDVDDLIDTLEGNRRYIKGFFVYNKIDTITMEDVDYLARQKDSVVLSCQLNLGTDYFLEKMWEYLGLVRVYTKKKGHPPDFEEPIVLRKNKGGYSIMSACNQIHRDLVQNFKTATVWGKSVKYVPQKCGLNHILEDEDVLQILKKGN
jgi:small GTP-binding protein